VAIDALIARMETMALAIPPGDPLGFFHNTYLRTTKAVAEQIRARKGFKDFDWVERWDVRFAELYLDALEAWSRAGPTPGPWVVAFEATKGPHLPPLRHVLLGMNAHINFDLPQALIAVISDEEFDQPELIAMRATDHSQIDEILASRVAAEDEELRKVEGPGDRRLVDRILTPFNHLGTKRFLKEARAKVWRNARLLSEARQAGRLEERIEELEELSRQRVKDLLRPGQVILELTRNGFGVSL
jgi:hypothetical protein